MDSASEPAGAASKASRPFAYTVFLSYSHAADGRLAEILQSALQRFAKPWYQRRALRVFRDTTGLGLTPDLWSSIRDALEASEYFVLFASEQAARSPWVELEVDTWLRTRSADRLLIAWTDGELAWDRAAGDFDWTRTTSLPARLRGVFRAEPLHLDLCWARTADDLSLRRPEFLDAVARLSATLRHQPVDDLLGEEIRQHRWTRRLAGATVAALSVFLVGALVAAGLALQQRNLARQQTVIAEEQRHTAEEQRREAEGQRAEADRQRTEAEEQRNAAEEQRRQAERQERIANEQREQSRQRLVRLAVSNGVRHLDERDVSGATLWFADALRLERGDPRGEGAQRIRLGAALRQHPRLLQVWSASRRAEDRWLAFSRDGRYLATDTQAGPRAWDIKTGTPLPLIVPATGQRIMDVDLTEAQVRVVTSGTDGVVRVWDTRSGAELSRLEHRDRVTSATFDSDGRLLVTASTDRVARVWDSRTGRLLTSLAHASDIVGAWPSRDGHRVLSTTEDNSAHVWTLEPPAHLALPHKEPVLIVDVAADGGRVLTLDRNQVVRVWDAATGRHASSLGNWEWVDYVELSRDGALAVMATRSGRARVWDIRRDQEVAFVDHAGPLIHVAFSPDGSRLATASTDRSARVWDARRGTPLLPPLYHEDTVSLVAWSPDQRQLATTTAPGIVRVWDLDTRPATFTHDRAVRLAAFWPDGRRLLTATDFGVRIWDLASTLPLDLRVAQQVHHAAVSPDGQRVVTASADGVARIWDPATGVEKLSLLHGRSLRHASFSRDGRRLATAGSQEVLVWDTATGAMLLRLPHDSPVTSAEFDRSGRRLVTLEFGGVARVWDVERGREVSALRRPDASYACFSPDGTRLAFVEGRITVAVRDAATGQLLFPSISQEYRIRHVAFSPDGRTLVAASDGAFGRVWDARTGTPVTAPLAHETQVLHAEFSPDGQRVVTASTDRTARVWDAATGQPVSPPLRHGGPVRRAVFSSDGLRVATASEDGTARVWELSAPASDARMILASQVLAARRIDETGAVVSLSTAEVRQGWAKLRASR